MREGGEQGVQDPHTPVPPPCRSSLSVGLTPTHTPDVPVNSYLVGIVSTGEKEGTRVPSVMISWDRKEVVSISVVSGQ